MHGHTYQGYPVACTAALEVQRVIQEDDLLPNVRRMGALLSDMLRRRLGSHPNVGDIRGRGLFWGIEFVADKHTARPFAARAHVALEIAERGLGEKYGIAVYPCSGIANGVDGDVVVVSPSYTVTEDDIVFIVDTVSRLITDYFASKPKL